ncbi:MAG TPA: hypothetical protein VGK04_11710 [Thermoanaerobaculia bacterium]
MQTNVKIISRPSLPNALSYRVPYSHAFIGVLVFEGCHVNCECRHLPFNESIDGEIYAFDVMT